MMTEGTPHPKGKVLIIGGSIANFTNVAATFKGIIRALETFADKLKQHNVVTYVRRGGPNYQVFYRDFYLNVYFEFTSQNRHLKKIPLN